MTILKAPLFSFSAQQSLADTLTYRQRRARSIAGVVPRPTDPHTNLQHQQRFAYTYWSRVWHFMTPAEKAAYNLNTLYPHETPYNSFMREKLATDLKLLLYLPCDSTTNNDLYDTYTRTYRGLGYGSVSVLGAVDRAYQYDGSDDYAFYSLNLISLSHWSFTFWAKSNLLDHYAFVIGKHIFAPAEEFYSLRYALVNTMFFFNTTIALANHPVTSDILPHFYCFVWSTPTIKFFRDNILVNTQNPGGLMKTVDTWQFIARAYEANWKNFNGWVDAITMFERAISDHEIRALYYEKQAIYKEIQP